MKILIVEDEIGISNFLSQGLQEEGFTVDVANQGDLGLQKALTEKYDLILLDWMLPKLSGLEICLKIREQNKVVPILFLTAKDYFITGITNQINQHNSVYFYYDNICPKLQIHDLVRNEKVSSVRYRRFSITEKGQKFLAYIDKKNILAKS